MADAIVVLLSCGHRREMSCRTDELDVYCTTCKQVQTVISQCDQWRVRCLDCRYSRSFGAARLAANYAADKHGAMQPAHRMQILHGPLLDHVRVPKLFLMELPLDVDTAPY